MLKTAIRLTVIAVLVAGILGIAWWWYDYYHSQEQTYTVQRGSVSGVIISGTLHCRRRTHIRSEVQAMVKKWHVTEGQEVQDGDLLLELDDALIAEQCARAEAQVAQARAQLLERDAEIDASEEAKNKAVAAYNHAVHQYDRFRESPGATTASEIENYKTQAMIAKAELGEVRARLELLKAGKREDTTDRYEAQLQLAQAQLRHAQTLRRKYTVRASHKGKVTKTFPHAGEMVSPDQELLYLHNFETLEIDGHAQESLQSRIRPGDKALVRPDAFDRREFEATVTQILPRVEENRGTMTVKLTFDTQPDVELPDGGTVDIVLVGDIRKEVVRVPIEAVEGSGDKAYVWLQVDGKYKKQPVKTGREDGRWVEVLQGLEPGQVIRLR